LIKSLTNAVSVHTTWFAEGIRKRNQTSPGEPLGPTVVSNPLFAKNFGGLPGSEQPFYYHQKLSIWQAYLGCMSD
jgi:hypothetical protein